MTIVVLSNPKSFVKEANSKNIYYEFLIEAIECLGQQKMARMFVGKSTRGELGTLSAASLLNWKSTFEFVNTNPNIIDSDSYQARNIEKRGDDWDQFVELIKKPIPDDVVKSWENLPNKKLGDAAIENGIELGVRNSKALTKLLEKMKTMVERRKINIWNKDYNTRDNSLDESSNPVNYQLKNIFELRNLCKERNIVQYHLKKEELITALINHDQKIQTNIVEKQDYESMTLMQLKGLAKDRTFEGYNKLNSEALIKLHKEYDEAMLKQNENKETESDVIDKIETKEFKLVGLNGETFNLLIQKDGMVNATMLCKAMGKVFYEYERSKPNQAFMEALSSESEIFREQLIQVRKGGDPKLQGTWIHRLLVIDVCRWGCPQFAVQITKWIDELLLTGSVQLKRPVKFLIELKQIDIEAEELELNHDFSLHTNKQVIYIAYIGKGLLKIGYSYNYIKRESKHQSCESEYPQFRIVKTLEVSGQNIETMVHNLLDRYRVNYNKQKEIYKPTSTIANFCEHIKNLLEENDLKFQLQQAKQEIMELRLKNAELELKMFTMMNKDIS
jgi:hypothetical protein